MGHPGTLPVFNRQVVDFAILAGERSIVTAALP